MKKFVCENWWIFVVFLVVVLAFGGGVWWTIGGAYKGMKPNEFGDSAGLVNAFFSALAFAGIIVTLVLQMRELALQRKEMNEMQQVQLLTSRIQILCANEERNSEEELELQHLQKYEARQIKEYVRNNDMLTYREAGAELFPYIVDIQSQNEIMCNSWIKHNEKYVYNGKLRRSNEEVAYLCLVYSRVKSLSDEERAVLRRLYSYISRLSICMVDICVYSRRPKNKRSENDSTAEEVYEAISVPLKRIDPLDSVDELDKRLNDAEAGLQKASAILRTRMSYTASVPVDSSEEYFPF